jgi:hypothetical protein
MNKLFLLPLVLLLACEKAPTEQPPTEEKYGVHIEVVDHSDGLYPDTVALHVRNWDFGKTDTTHYMLTLPGIVKKGTVMVESFSFIIEYRAPEIEINLIVWTSRSTNNTQYITP